MRLPRLLPVMTILAHAGCASGASAGGAGLPADSLVGTYELESIVGRPVPLRQFQAVYHAGRITLHADHRYVSEFDVESCTTDAVCTRETTTAVGRWRVLDDGTLALEPRAEAAEHAEEEEDHGPPPRIEADGREIRYYTPSVAVPIFRYTRL